jgi:ATP-dependent RNA helicase HelY
MTSAAGNTPTSPADRYARHRRRRDAEGPHLSAFRDTYPFGLDPFQEQACAALACGRGVLIAAPTGSGKTVVGEFAVHLALAEGLKAFYTTPIKALSNQKYNDLVRRHGPDKVGLLTGDNTINGDAPVVVMTTEVLRNMLYASSPALDHLGYVVMDEVHYLADRFRGAVWEEIIIHLPQDVRLVSLSATVSNAEEFGAWLDTVRGDTEVVVSEHRPVPLGQHLLHGRRLYDLFAPDRRTGPTDDTGPQHPSRVNPELHHLTRTTNDRRPTRRGRRGPHHGRGRGHHGVTPRPEVISTLDHAGLLPAIVFVFSRAGCDAALAQCLTSGVRLTTATERDAVRRLVRARCTDVPEQDLDVLGYWEWTRALERGLACHHAGLLPTFKETVEELFVRGLVKVVFATETLALGINMPARSVVLEKLLKWNGETHADITPGEYTQLTGRAGRRGIDIEGHAVVLHRPGLDPDAVAGLASTRTYQLRSSFRPTYNMAVNLVGQFGRDRAREILQTSFAQFQADRAVVGLARQVRRHEEALAGYAQALHCDLGDFPEYAALRRAVRDRETALSRTAGRERTDAARAGLETLRRGDVVRLAGGRHAGWAVVLDNPTAADGQAPTVLTAQRAVRRLAATDLTTPLTPLTRLTVPRHFNPRNAHDRANLASHLRATLQTTDHRPPDRPGKKRSPAADDGQLTDLRARLRSHPCHRCPDREDHARWAERWWRLSRETQALTRRIEGRTNSIARVFDRVCDLLTERDYLAGDTVTPHGHRLRRLYTETDLMVAEGLRENAWTGLDPAELAAAISTLVYESRRDDNNLAPRLPTTGIHRAHTTMTVLWSALEEHERDHRLPTTPAPAPGLAWTIHRWAEGHDLDAVLKDSDLAPGDFVRWTKQVIDLLGQIQLATTDPALRRTAVRSVDRLRRGVVAHSSLL